MRSSGEPGTYWARPIEGPDVWCGYRAERYKKPMCSSRAIGAR